MDPNQARIEFAKNLAPFWETTGAQSAVVGGSTGRLMADKFSDLEIALYYQTLPTDQDRLRMLKEISADQNFPFKKLTESSQQIEDNVTVQRLRVDLIHCKFAVVEDCANRLIREFDADLSIQSIAASLLTAEVLHGPELLQPVIERLSEYPEELAFNTINRQIPLLGASQLDIADYRGDRHMYYAILSSQHRRILPILFAMNRRFYPGEKNMSKSSEGLQVLGHINSKLCSLYDLPADEAAKAFDDILDEIVCHCKSQFPEIDDKLFVAKRQNKRHAWP